MNDEDRLAMVRDAQRAQRAGVVLSLKDWRKMSEPERAAWIVALERPRLDGADGAPPIPPPPEVHGALVASATRVAGGEG